MGTMATAFKSEMVENVGMEKYMEFLLDKAEYLLQHDYILYFPVELSRRKGSRCSGMIYLTANRKYYHCEASGSFSTDANRRELKFLLETIFESYSYMVFKSREEIALTEATTDYSMWIMTDGDFPYDNSI